MTVAAIDYNQGYINNIVDNAELALSNYIYALSNDRAASIRNDRFEIDIQKLTLIIQSLSNYTVDGTNDIDSWEMNLLIEEAKKLIDSVPTAIDKDSGGSNLSSEFLQQLLQDNGFSIIIP